MQQLVQIFSNTCTLKAIAHLKWKIKTVVLVSYHSLYRLRLPSLGQKNCTLLLSKCKSLIYDSYNCRSLLYVQVHISDTFKIIITTVAPCFTCKCITKISTHILLTSFCSLLSVQVHLRNWLGLTQHKNNNIITSYNEISNCKSNLTITKLVGFYFDRCKL
jgi:hypothetical protein